MRAKLLINTFIFLVSNSIIAQTTEQFSISNGDGWYRILEKNWQGSGKIKISGISGSNRVTNLTMYVSLMEYGQGGSINIVENSFYNKNHIREIRGGSNNGKYVLDIYLEGINNPTNITITKDDNIDLLDSPIFNPSDNLTGKIEISGRVIGINSTRHPIYFSNNVGIGTVNSNGWELAVNGKIRAKEIKVETGWSDFVFKKEYKLSTLEEVENHIKEKGHLKDIPSAKEVEKNGIYLGEMDSKLLQKIEELTLYTITQEKKLKAQNERIKYLEMQNSRIEKLEKENKTLQSLAERFTKIEKQLENKK